MGTTVASAGRFSSLTATTFIPFHFGGLSSSSGSLAMVAAIVLASSLVMRWRVCPISDGGFNRSTQHYSAGALWHGIGTILPLSANILDIASVL